MNPAHVTDLAAGDATLPLLPPVHLVLFSNIADTRAGGMGNWTHEVALVLRARGHRVTTWFADSLPAVATGRLAVLLHPVAFAFRAVRAREGVDAFVVHEPSGYWYGLLRHLWRRLPPMVAMCHNVENRHVAQLDAAARVGLAARRSPLRRLRYALARAWQSEGTIRFADHVVVLSEFDRAWVTGRLGRAERDVTLMLNGVAPASRTAAARRRGMGVLVVGGWHDTKGRLALPRLWRAVRAAEPGARLTIVGTGAGPDGVLGDFAAEDRASVTVIPRVDSSRAMAPLYDEADVLLLPSISEGSPLAVLEGMRSGVGIVASCVGGVPLLLRDGHEALLYDALRPADGAAAVVALLRDDARRLRLGDAARARAAELTWDRTAAMLLASVQSARGEHPAALPSAMARATTRERA